MRVRFTPQAWINDYAVDIDPDGETEWEVSPEGLEALAAYPDYEDALAYETWFLSDPNAPEWVRQHSGPFRIIDLDAAVAQYYETHSTADDTLQEVE